jgi:hypothetical protein
MYIVWRIHGKLFCLGLYRHVAHVPIENRMMASYDNEMKRMSDEMRRMCDNMSRGSMSASAPPT